MAQAKVTSVLNARVVLADVGEQKGIRVSIPVNGTAPKAGDAIEISAVKASRRPVKGKDAAVVLDANFLGAVAKEAKK